MYLLLFLMIIVPLICAFAPEMIQGYKEFMQKRYDRENKPKPFPAKVIKIIEESISERNMGTMVIQLTQGSSRQITVHYTVKNGVIPQVGNELILDTVYRDGKVSHYIPSVQT